LDSKPFARNLLTFWRHVYFNLDTRFDKTVSLSLSLSLSLSKQYGINYSHIPVPYGFHLLVPGKVQQIRTVVWSAVKLFLRWRRHVLPEHVLPLVVALLQLAPGPHHRHEDSWLDAVAPVTLRPRTLTHTCSRIK
jgi:hypothetical protein